MEYYFNELNPTSFQKLVCALLVKRYGTDIRLSPILGPDGGQDAETAPNHPDFTFTTTISGSVVCKRRRPSYGPNVAGFPTQLSPGRYLFQIKFHRTQDRSLSDVRRVVSSDFERELTQNVLSKTASSRVNYFFLITNVPSSVSSISRIDVSRQKLVGDRYPLHADVLWQEHLVAELDQAPELWPAYAELFPGRIPPLLGRLMTGCSAPVERAIHSAMALQYKRDSTTRFQQIDLEAYLAKLFVDLDVNVDALSDDDQRVLQNEESRSEFGGSSFSEETNRSSHYMRDDGEGVAASGLVTLVNESLVRLRKIVLEGGPGQGKSTITQALAQIHRGKILGLDPGLEHAPRPSKARLPFRIDLRKFAEVLSKNTYLSVEAYLAEIIKNDSGGTVIDIDDIRSIIGDSPSLLIFDGLDEVGSYELRDKVLGAIDDTLTRLEGLRNDVRVVLTTRPAAVAGHGDRLEGFARIPLVPMSRDKILRFLTRWLSRLPDSDERERIKAGLTSRLGERHVMALARNPMQLSVLLHFVRLKGDAFPDKRADLYHDYFGVAIDRDVEKSPSLREKRALVESLHQFLGYHIHALTEAKKANGSLDRDSLLKIVSDWLRSSGSKENAAALFQLGEERLGLLCAIQGEGENTSYGFQIQPIREYFAAAFINDQIVGNAHEVLEYLLRCQYWNEVALFLAGLRRPNERSDILSRARVLDSNEEEGWRLDGREFIFSLLEQGVFSQPAHVCIDALDFVMDVLDPRIVAGTTGILSSGQGANVVGELIRASGSEKLISRLRCLSKDNAHSNDMSAVHDVLSVAAASLEVQEAKNLLLSYIPESASALAFVRAGWGEQLGIDLSAEMSDIGFWGGMPRDSVARALWRSDAGRQAGMSDNLPDGVHELLLRELATSGQGVRRHLGAGRDGQKGRLAVWLLRDNLIALSGTVDTRLFGHGEFVAKSCEVNYSDLGEEIKSTVRELLAVCDAMWAIPSDRGDLQTMEGVFGRLLDPLSRLGLSSLLAARVAVVMVRFSSWQLRGRRLFRPVSEMDYRSLLAAAPGIALVWDMAKELLNVEIAARKGDRVGRTSTGIVAVPVKAIRIAASAQPVPLIDLLREHIWSGGNSLYGDVIEGAVTRSGYAKLLDGAGDDAVRILKFIGMHRRPRVDCCLPTPLVDFILSVCQQTEDNEVLAGAIDMLTRTDGVLARAGFDMSLKLLRATKVYGDFPFPHNSAEDRDDILVRVQLGKRILQESKIWPRDLVSFATQYLKNQVAVRVRPLIEMEEILGIRVR